MKANFFQPRFTGPRFEEHTLPLEFVSDLEAYEQLVVELAKHLFLAEHPGRQRVPKGFSSDFHLHLAGVEGGSARPLLSLVTAGALVLGDGVNPFFERARDLITQCVGGIDGHLPHGFPRELLVHFNQIGRSLRSDESMEFSSDGSTPVALTPARRKQLVLALDKVYEEEIEIEGSIGEADWEKSTFRLRLLDETHVVVPMNPGLHEMARRYGGNPRHLVTVKGIGAFDSSERIQKIVSVNSIEVQPDYQLNARFEELATIQDGWFDGNGSAPDPEKLLVVAEHFIGHFPPTVPLPTVVPMPDGNLLFEWDMTGSPSVDLRLSDLTAEFHMFTAPDEELESEFGLADEKGWDALHSFLSDTLGRSTA